MVFLNGKCSARAAWLLEEIVAKLDTGAAAATPPSSAPRRLTTC
jgi:alkyl hydroperoxide reductase subunit AhpF